MLNSVVRWWRVFGTGVSFVAVGVGGVFVFPVLNIVIQKPQLRSALARHVISFSFRCIVGLMRIMGVFRYEITGLERLERNGLLILANHPTLIDIVFLMAFVKRADCIVKSGLWRNPFTHSTVRAAAYVRNDDHGVQLIEDCVAAIRRGGNLIIFLRARARRTMAQSCSNGARPISRYEACAILLQCLYAARRRC